MKTLEELGWGFVSELSTKETLVFLKERMLIRIDLKKHKIDLNEKTNSINFMELEAIRNIIYFNAIR